jgi:CrcB protein
MPVVAVVLGGLLGTGLRIGLDALIHHDDTQFPWSTLLINVVGSFALGLLVARVWPGAPAWLRAGLGAGLLGSFTTFSAFAVSLVTLTRAGEGGMALIYLVVSVAAGLAAAALGLRLGGARPARAAMSDSPTGGPPTAPIEVDE